MSVATVNPITVEVVRNGLAQIANEMATVLRKTSYNMMIYEVRDYCVGIVDPDGNILSQNFGALPIFLADLGPAIVDGVCKRPSTMTLLAPASCTFGAPGASAASRS